MAHIGIDPGVSGGIAIIWTDPATNATATYKMPESDRDLLSILAPFKGHRAVLEKVHASPQMGRSSAFTFGMGYGRLRMALVAAGIPFDEVSPVRWQGVMGIRQKTGATVLGKSPKKDKNISKRRAQELFPTVLVTHAVADALLLAEYCRRLHTGVLA